MARLPDGKTAKELGFKVGDRFRVLEPANSFRVGDVITLDLDDNSKCPWFTLPSQSAKRNDCINFCRLEPLEERPIQYKVGDKVRVGKRRPKNNTGFPRYDGEVGKVVDIETGFEEVDCFGHKRGESIYLVHVDGSYAGRFAASELEPCADAPIRKQKPPYKFKPGDKVRNKLSGKTDEVVSVPGMPEYDKHYFSDASEGFLLQGSIWEYQRDWELVRETETGRWDLDLSAFKSLKNIATNTDGWIKPRQTAMTYYQWDYLVKLNDEPKKEKTIMSNIKDKIKVLAMSDDNKALHEAGFIDADGDLTDKGQDALEEVQYQTLRPELVKLARQLTEDDKKKEKKSK